MMYFLFVTTTALAIQRYGKNVIFIFSFIIISALALEIRPINEGGFEYLNFLFYIFKYPIVLPLAWCVLFFWVHNFSEGLIEIDDKILTVISNTSDKLFHRYYKSKRCKIYRITRKENVKK